MPDAFERCIDPDVEIINGHALVTSWWAPLQVAPLQCDYSSTPPIDAIEPVTAVLTLGKNPAAGYVSLALAMPHQGFVHLAMHDVQGRRMRELFHGPLSIGTHAFRWDGRNEEGADVAAGVYFVHFMRGVSSVSQRVVLLR